MVEFVGAAFPHGFRKTVTARQVPRARYEAIAVGSGLALRERSDLLDSADPYGRLGKRSRVSEGDHLRCRERPFEGRRPDRVRQTEARPDVRSYEELLSGRTGEIESHLLLIKELTAAAIARQGIANLQRVEMEHVDVLKSGFLVHLYNVVEAVMTKILEEVAADVIRYPPAKWSSLVRTEWVRTRAGRGAGESSRPSGFRGR